MSGSQDCTCILWDLDNLNHVARLPAHREGISAVAISDVSVRPLFLNVCVLNMSVSLCGSMRGSMVDSAPEKTQGRRDAGYPRMLRGPQMCGAFSTQEGGAINMRSTWV